MNFIAIILVLVSCFTHAGWNLASKFKTPSAAFFALSTLSAVVVMTPLYIHFSPHLLQVPLRLWGFVIAAGFCEAFCFIGLGNSYRLNDISLAYPLTLSLPVLLVPLVCWCIGYGKPLSFLAISGMIVIATGCIILPLKAINFSLLKQYFQYSFLFVVLTAVGITGFTVIDSMGVTVLKLGDKPLTTMQAALFYVAFDYLFAALFLWSYVWLSRRERANVRTIRQNSLHYPILAGPVVAVTYTLVLLAMQFASNVSYIVAFRQVSVLIGVFFGFFILKEKATPFKIIGTLLIFAGLVLAALG